MHKPTDTIINKIKSTYWFRTKNKKISVADQRITLDASHSEMMNYFEELQNYIRGEREKIDAVELTDEDIDFFKAIQGRYITKK